MANLGNLWFELLLKDNTQVGINAAMKRLQNLRADVKLGVDSNVMGAAVQRALNAKQYVVKVNPVIQSTKKLSLQIDDRAIQNGIRKAIEGQAYRAKVEVIIDKASVSKAVREAFNRAGMNYNTSAGDVRSQRILEIQARMAQNAAIAQEKLRAAHERASRAAQLNANSQNRVSTSMDNSSRAATALRGQLMNVFSVYAAEQFIRQLYTIGGEFQKQHIALESILGSAGKADAIFARLKAMAPKSPFQFSELAAYTKQVVAFGIPYEELYDTMKRLSDLSAGLGVDMGRITLAYGQVRSAAFLRGQELRQFTEAGIPLVEKLAEKLEILEGQAVSAGDVFERISKREIGFGMVKDVLWDMTSEGGQFYNMQEKLAESLAGKWSNLKDSWDIMIADIAQGSSGVLGGAVELLTSMMNSWRTMAGVLLPLISALGSYRVAMMLVNAAHKAEASMRTITFLANLTRARQGLTYVTRAQAVAQHALNASMKANPIGIMIAALGAAVTAFMIFNEKEETAAEYIRKTNASLEEQRLKSAELKQEASRLADAIHNKNLTYGEQKAAYDRLNEMYPELFKNMDLEKVKTMELIELKKRMSDAQDKQTEATYRNAVTEAKTRLEDLKKQQRTGLITVFGTTTRIDISDEEIADAQKAYDNALAQLDGFLKQMEDKAKERIAPWRLEVQKLVKESGLAEMYNPNETEGYTQWLDRLKGKIDELKKANSGLQEEGKWSGEEFKKNAKEAETLTRIYTEMGGAMDVIKQPKTPNRDEEKQAEKLAEKLLDIRRKNQQDGIDLMDEGTEKKLAQIEMDYRKQMEAIRKNEEELTKASGGLLTEEQAIEISLSYTQAEDMRQKERANVLKDAEKEHKEKLEADKRAWQEYFIEYGNYQEKRKNLIQKYDDEIAKLQAGSPERATKAAEKERELSELDEQYGKSTKAMADLFEDASDKSVNAIQAVIDKYELLVSYLSGGNGVTVGNLKAVGFTDKDLKSIEDGTINIKDVTDAIKKLKNTLSGKSPFKKFAEDIEEGFKDIKNGSVSDGVSKIGKAVEQFSDPLKEFGSDIANIFGIDDSKITGAVDTLKGLGQTAAGVGQIMSGDIVGGAMSAVSGISQVVSALDGMFGADYSRYNEMVEQYEVLNGIWDELIDKKKEYIDISYGVEADKAGKEALELAEKSIESYRILGKERLNAGASAGSHSIGVRTRKNMSKQGWDELWRAAESIGFNYDSVAGGRMTGLFDLTTEQLEKLKAEAPTFWAKLDGDVREYLDNIIEGAEMMEEIQQQMQENATLISFESMRDNFVDALMDMDAKAEDFADDFKNYLMKAVLTAQINNLMGEQLQAYYDKWYEFMKDDWKIDSGERSELEALQQALIDQGITIRDEIANSLGYTGKGSGSDKGGLSKIGQSLTEETGGLLASYANGIRADTSVMRYLQEKFFGEDFPQISVLAQAQLQELGKIVKNTERNANTADDILALLNSVSNGTKSIKVK